jgi:hypothetical protein
MSNAITISLVVNAVVGMGWIARFAPGMPYDWRVNGMVDSVRLQFSGQTERTEMPMPFNPTKIAIRAENGELNLVIYGSLEAPESWRRHGPPVVYVYPDRDVTVGDVVDALDEVQDRAPAGTVVVTELR